MCASNCTSASGPCRFASARRIGSEIEWSPPITIGRAPASAIAPMRVGHHLVALLDADRRRVDVADVRDVEAIERRHLLKVAVGPDQRRLGAHLARAEPRAGPVRGAAVVGHADNRDVETPRILHVRQPHERRRVREARRLKRRARLMRHGWRLYSDGRDTRGGSPVPGRLRGAAVSVPRRRRRSTSCATPSAPISRPTRRSPPTASAASYKLRDALRDAGITAYLHLRAAAHHRHRGAAGGGDPRHAAPGCRRPTPRRLAAAIAASGSARSRPRGRALEHRARAASRAPRRRRGRHRRQRLRQPLHRHSPERRTARAAAARSTDGARTSPRQPQHRRVLHVRVRHDDRRRLARPDGRLADARRSGRRHPRLPARRPAAVSDRAHLRPAGPAHPGRRRRDRLHRRRDAAVGQLRRRLDDGAVVRDRVPVGSGGHRQPAGARLSRRSTAIQLYAIGGSPIYAPRLAVGLGADRADRRRQLPRHQAERHLSGRDDVRPAGDVRDLHAARLRQGLAGEHAAAVSRRRRRRGCRSSWCCRSCPTS